MLTLSAYAPGAEFGNRNCPFSFVTWVEGPLGRAGELIVIEAPGKTPPDSSLTVPMMVPVMTWADAEIETITVAASARTVINLKDFMLTSLIGLGLRCIRS